MSVLDLVLLPDDRLHQVSAPVTEFNKELKTIVRNMGETMHAENGIGLAGVQVGIMKQILVIDISDMDNEESESSESRRARERKKNINSVEAYINPKITQKIGDTEYEEGCLSIPGVYAKVKRSETITVEYNDVDGNLIEEEASGLRAIVLQHEIDHLNGVLFIDRLGPMQKMMVMGKYKKLRSQADEDKEGA